MHHGEVSNIQLFPGKTLGEREILLHSLSQLRDVASTAHLQLVQI